jgi:predicted ATPase
VGRETQIQEVASWLRSRRLVTLIGSGGIGKTRLALQVARRLQTDDAAYIWIALNSTIDESTLTAAVANALPGGEELGPITIETLLASIGDQKLVLVLDNCEQVIAACADLVLRLLEGCGGLRVLATSREPLGLPGEVIYRVPPLAVTGSDEASSDRPSEAVQLFFDRVLGRDAQLQVAPESQALAVRICAACDGIPLAVELAAACVGSMTPFEIADRLDDALGLLRFGSRVAPARQQSLRASIDWSHRLLSNDEQLLLRRLSLFEAEFTLADAEWVCAFDGLQTIEIGYLLDHLVAQSLVHAFRDGPTTRFCLWRPVRQYGLEQLEQAGELARARARLMQWSAGGFGHKMTVATEEGQVGVVEAMPEQPLGDRLVPEQSESTGRRHGGLSEREYAVVHLVAGGRSNREIAEELVITKKTAEAHVSHILTKLGLCSRVQIATWSLQSGVAEVSARQSPERRSLDPEDTLTRKPVRALNR